MPDQQAPTPSLKDHVYTLVDDWLGLGDLDDRPIEGESEFEQWVEKKIKAGDGLSSFAEEVIDELLGQFKGTKRDVGPELDRIKAAAEKRGKEQGWDEAMTSQIQRLISGDPDVERFQMPANPYRADQEGDE